MHSNSSSLRHCLCRKVGKEQLICIFWLLTKSNCYNLEKWVFILLKLIIIILPLTRPILEKWNCIIATTANLVHISCLCKYSGNSVSVDNEVFFPDRLIIVRTMDLLPLLCFNRTCFVKKEIYCRNRGPNQLPVSFKKSDKSGTESHAK